MKILGLVFVGLVAAGATYLTLTSRDDQLVIITGLIGAFSWALFAYLSLEIVVYDANGSPNTTRYPSLVAWGLMMAAPNLYIALTGPLELVRDREALRQEVR